MTREAGPTSLISMPEIAELAGVRRPVVTTWRRRHPDFPAPVAGDRGRALFDAHDLVDWLVRTGRAERERIEPDLRLHLLSCLTTGGGGPTTMRPPELTGALTALICLRHLDGEPLHPGGSDTASVTAALRRRAAMADPEDLLVRAEVDALPSGAPWLATMVDELVEAAWGCHQAYERVLAHRTRLGVPDLYVDAVDNTLARLVAGLSGVADHAEEHGEVRLCDPAAGTGDLLHATLDHLGEDADATVSAGSPDRFTARLLRRRLVVRGLPPPDLDIHIGYAGQPLTPPDVLVTALPYQPKEARADADPLARVQRLTEKLAPGQTAVIVGPADLLVGALPPYRPAVRTRGELLASGRVEAVISLPGGLMPFRPGYQPALWVLRREDPSPWQGRVLLADVSDRPLTDQVVDDLVWDVTTWRRGGHRPDQHLRAHAAQVRVDTLTAPRVPLTTRRPPGPPPLIDRTGQMVAWVSELEAHLHALARTARPMIVSGLGASVDEPAPPPRRPLGDLIRRGWLTAVKGHRVAAGHVRAGGQHPVLGAPELTGEAPIGDRTMDREVLADHYPRLTLTEPGDVVVTMTPRWGLHLDRDGFAVVEFPARVLRIRAARFTPRVLASLLASQARDTPPARAAGAVRPAPRLRELQVPVPAPAELARLDALLATLDTRWELARRELDTLAELTRVATDGVADGTLTITDPAYG